MASGDSPFARQLGFLAGDFSADDEFSDDDEDEAVADGELPSADDSEEDDDEPIMILPMAVGAQIEGSESAEDEDEGSDDDASPDEEAPKKHFFSPFEQLFGSSFQPGGAAYADGASEKKGRKGRKEKKYKYLDTYCSNLTRKAREGKIDRIIGRDREIERIVQILSRRQKNNPCLIGEPGVGKTAIAEGLALRIVAGCVPQRLAEKQLFLLDLTALVAGTQFRGQFESRIKGLIDEVKSVGNVILFIDEVHNLVGTGDAEGSMNAANILKPALSRGELQVIGATTFTEYRKHIEKDTALERRFQPVKVEEPSVAEAIEVLRGIKDYYEEHHGVTFSDDMIVRAVTLAERYINDRFLPDKAIDLLDEACACAALRNKAKEETVRLNTELDKARTKMEHLSERNDGAPTEADFQKVAELRTQILRLEQRIEELRPEADESDVTEGDLARVIELWTGIPASRIEESEYKRLVQLADRLKGKIKGQDEAVELVSAAIRRSRVQISPRRRPASFIFVGPTGVGKTELVKVLAAELFDAPETLIRLDMSEFMEKHSVSRIIGSPPGYVGYDEAGQLTEKVRRKPYSVVLFDEIEKAHPDVLNILLQILDEGKINDAQGRTVSFENTVIVMTSNAGSNSNTSSLGFAKSAGELAKEKALKALSDFLRPEFLARVDEVVCFNTLTDEDFAAIARLMCSEYVPSLAEKGCELIVENEVFAWLAARAKGGKSAARDLRSLIRREVEDKMAQLLIEYGAVPPKRIVVSVRDDSIAVNIG
ncbi:MAG: ATP-dependent Clp protease ATP-binding subunit [Ruminococcaceae bacterium]|nr:ATP-dependent Clp protease ATP-binding subunit [Oscillospiraceae bacterium]